MTYKEQFDRMKRFLSRIDHPQYFHGEQTDYEDNLWCFFQNAWHLKDHIVNDDSIISSEIGKIAEEYSSLRICADLANRTKHSILTKKIRVDAKHIKTDVRIIIPSSLNDTISNSSKDIQIMKAEGSLYKYIIEDNTGNEYDAIDLANKIVADWEEIISHYVTTKVAES